MPVRVYITIDTEEDQWGEYLATDTSVNNVTMIPKLQRLFDKYGALPTYLINYPVVMNHNAKKIIKDIYDSKRCGIGMHCHPWNTPPLEEGLSNYNSMLCNLPQDLVNNKLRTLHQAIVHNWGVSPICFRAGRWGFGENVARCIYELGYRVDTSISPFSNWTDYEGPDFSDASTDQYLFNPDNIFSHDPKGHLLEVPPTIGFLQRNFYRCAWLRKKILSSKLPRYRLLGILDRLGVLNLRWLSPEGSNGEDMVRLSESFIKHGCNFLNMSFHSTSVYPGYSPFVRSESDLDGFLKNIEVFLKYAYHKGLKFSCLDEALEN